MDRTTRRCVKSRSQSGLSAVTLGTPGARNRLETNIETMPRGGSDEPWLPKPECVRLDPAAVHHLTAFSIGLQPSSEAKPRMLT